MSILDELKRIIKYGEIVSVNKDNTVRVLFKDFDEMVSFDLPVLSQNAGENKQQSLPDVGATALCLMMPTGHTDGFVLGCFYPKGKAPISSESKKMHWTFSDGTVLEYDTEEHKLFADVKGKIIGKAKETEIESPEVKIIGDVVVEGGLKVIIGKKVVASVGAGEFRVNGKMHSTEDITTDKKIDAKAGVKTNGNVEAKGTVTGANI